MYGWHNHAFKWSYSADTSVPRDWSQNEQWTTRCKPRSHTNYRSKQNGCPTKPSNNRVKQDLEPTKSPANVQQQRTAQPAFRITLATCQKSSAACMASSQSNSKQIGCCDTSSNAPRWLAHDPDTKSAGRFPIRGLNRPQGVSSALGYPAIIRICRWAASRGGA